MIEWWIRLAAALSAAAERAGRLAEQLAADWADDHGRERAERLVVLQRELEEQAERAQRVVDRADDDPAPSLGLRLPGLLQPGRSADRQLGVRLPGLEAERVDDEPGVRLPGS